MRRIGGIAFGWAALWAVLAAGADASTQIGQTFNPTGNCGPRTRLQGESPAGQYAAPFAGVITSWSIQSSSGGSSGNPTKLKVARAVGGDNFTIVGESDAHDIPDADSLNSFATRIPVQAGDIIGLYTAPASVFLCARSGQPGYVVGEGPFGSDVMLGATSTFTPVDGQQLDVSASLEPDCDLDGFGDETQDAFVDQTVCDQVPPETTITRQPKDKTKKKLTTFEFSSSESGSTFQCSLDGDPFAPCSSPDVFKVKRGKHSFAVRATDPVGNADPTPASDDWKVKKKRKK